MVQEGKDKVKSENKDNKIEKMEKANNDKKTAKDKSISFPIVGVGASAVGEETGL